VPAAIARFSGIENATKLLLLATNRLAGTIQKLTVNVSKTES
jgi:hypothetical protein